jgi:energy-coupling factor transporter transmembrane protein EcfT
MNKLVARLRKHWLWPVMIVPVLGFALMYLYFWRFLSATFNLIDKLSGGQ